VSVSLASQASEMMSIRELQIWIAEHLHTKLSVEDLADRMSMSVRNFERVLLARWAQHRSQYVLQTRVERRAVSSNVPRKGSSRWPWPLDSGTST